MAPVWDCSIVLLKRTVVPGMLAHEELQNQIPNLKQFPCWAGDFGVLLLYLNVNKLFFGSEASCHRSGLSRHLLLVCLTWSISIFLRADSFFYDWFRVNGCFLYRESSESPVEVLMSLFCHVRASCEIRPSLSQLYQVRYWKTSKDRLPTSLAACSTACLLY